MRHTSTETKLVLLLLVIALGVAVAGGVASAQVPCQVGDPCDIGQWDPPMNSAVVARHAVVLHTGEVLLWEDGSATTLWDPIANTFALVPAPDDLFCSGHCSLADGRVLVIGGKSEGFQSWPGETNTPLILLKLSRRLNLVVTDNDPLRSSSSSVTVGVLYAAAKRFHTPPT